MNLIVKRPLSVSILTMKPYRYHQQCYKSKKMQNDLIIFPYWKTQTGYKHKKNSSEELFS